MHNFSVWVVGDLAAHSHGTGIPLDNLNSDSKWERVLASSSSRAELLWVSEMYSSVLDRSERAKRAHRYIMYFRSVYTHWRTRKRELMTK